MRNVFALCVHFVHFVSTLQNYSTKTIVFLERLKFWFNVNGSEQMTLANSSVTDSKSWFFLLVNEKMNGCFC